MFGRNDPGYKPSHLEKAAFQRASIRRAMDPLQATEITCLIRIALHTSFEPGKLDSFVLAIVPITDAPRWSTLILISVQGWQNRSDKRLNEDKGNGNTQLHRVSAPEPVGEGCAETADG